MLQRRRYGQRSRLGRAGAPRVAGVSAAYTVYAPGCRSAHRKTAKLRTWACLHLARSRANIRPYATRPDSSR